MTVVTLSTSGTWSASGAGCIAGTVVEVEAYGGGSGGSGRKSTNTFGAGGAGGAYAETPYFVLTPDNITNGVVYTIGSGSAGGAQANPLSGGGITTFSNHNLNLIQNATNTGAVPGVGNLPLSWNSSAVSPLSLNLVQTGTTSGGFAFVDFQFVGTAAGGEAPLVYAIASPLSPATTYVFSARAAIVGGTTTHVSGFTLNMDAGNSGGGFISNFMTTPITLTTTLTQFSGSGTTPALTANATCSIAFNCTAGPIDITIRFAAMQTEAGSVVTAWKSTPCYTAASGGGAPSGTTGGSGTAVNDVIGFAGFDNKGGNGANFNSGGSGGGGAGAPGGIGGSGTTAGQGGASGGGTAGGAVKATSPGNPGTTDTLNGGGGGGGLKTVAGTGGAGGTPGGGGGGAAVAAGTGGNGAPGQITLTFTLPVPTARPRTTRLNHVRR